MKKPTTLIILFLLILQSCHSHKTVTDRSNYFSNYSIYDKATGTETNMVIKGNNRVLTSNSLPDHEVGAFPNPGNPNTIKPIKKTYTIPVTPKYLGKAKWVKEPGIALNGIKFDPGTGEAVRCETGENYRIEAFQDKYDMGLDYNHAHVQPTGEYHYHGVPTGVVNINDKGDDLVHVGFAMDGFAIYYSKSDAYRPSYRVIDEAREGTDCVYNNPKTNNTVLINGSKADGTYLSDWEYVKGLGDLDECNGIEIDGQYRYLVTKEYPYVARCLMGEFTEQRGKGPRGEKGKGPRDGKRPPRNGQEPPGGRTNK